MKLWHTSVLLGALLGGIAYAQLQRDTDGDGAISLAEFQAAQAARSEARFQRLDTDGNGLLTPEEIQAGRRDGSRERDGRDSDGRGGRSFNRLDSNQDGNLSLEELQLRHPGAGTELFGQIDTNSDGVVNREEWAAGRERAAEWVRERLAAVDTDGDDAWSLTELQAAWPNFPAERFSRMDRDGDGLIRADERPRRGPRGPDDLAPGDSASR